MENLPIRVPEEEIEAAKTPKGGWTRDTLAKWGVPWPAPRGWKYALINGLPVPTEGVMSDLPLDAESQPDSLEAALLHKLVLTLINAGQGHYITKFQNFPHTTSLAARPSNRSSEAFHICVK